jgi:hypothetical protein
MVRKRKSREEREERDAALALSHADDADGYGETSLYYEDTEGDHAIHDEDGGGGEGGEGGEGGGDEKGTEEEKRRKKRNLHGRYKKRKVVQEVKEKIKCGYVKEDGVECTKAVHEGSDKCRKHGTLSVCVSCMCVYARYDSL